MASSANGKGEFVTRLMMHTAADEFKAWWEQYEKGQYWRHYKTGDGCLDDIGIGPGRVVILGGDTGNCKSSFSWQLMIEALRYNPDLKLVAWSFELSGREIFIKQLARLASVDVDAIRKGTVAPEEHSRLLQARDTLLDIFRRVQIADNETTLPALLHLVEEFGATLVFVDYVQKIRLGKDVTSLKERVETVLDELRKLVHDHKLTAVVGVSKLSRRNADSPRHDLHSFAEASEIEYAADDAYILELTPKDSTLKVRHVKHRFEGRGELVLKYYPKYQRFVPKEAK
jgi:replicative DNA helicase